MNKVLSVENLSKRKGGRDIVRHVSFDIFEGEVFGFLGPNGAGKTTTIRMLVGLVRPSGGKITLCGYDLRKQRRQALARVGCIVENPELYPFLTGYENLEYFAAMLPDVTHDRIREVIHIVGMDGRIHDKVKTYSLGMRQRLGIAQALLGNPRLLILDEPTNGLDPIGIKELRELIRRLARSGLTLFISSHMLGEIQSLCDRVAIIRKGTVIAVGTVRELLRDDKNRVHWHVRPPEKAKSLLEGDGRIHWLDGEDNEDKSGVLPLCVRMNPRHIPEINRKLVENGVDVFAIETKQMTLEDLFLRLTEGEIID